MRRYQKEVLAELDELARLGVKNAEKARAIALQREIMEEYEQNFCSVEDCVDLLMALV